MIGGNTMQDINTAPTVATKPFHTAATRTLSSVTTCTIPTKATATTTVS